MRIDIYGLTFETPEVVVYLWSPWRCLAIEHRLFEVMRELPGIQVETGNDEWKFRVTDTKTWKNLLHIAARVLKGWQEEASDLGGTERRIWHWLIEGDTDEHSYDHTGERACLWAFLRLTMERNNPEDSEASEFIDLNGFGIQIQSMDT